MACLRPAHFSELIIRHACWASQVVQPADDAPAADAPQADVWEPPKEPPVLPTVCAQSLHVNLSREAYSDLNRCWL